MSPADPTAPRPYDGVSAADGGHRPDRGGPRPQGPRLGVDPGEVRVGLAISDPAGVLASPLQTLRRDHRESTDLDQIARIVAERDVVEVIVGHPRLLSGRVGTSARAAGDYATELARLIDPIPVRLSDERLTTVTANRQLAERGRRGRAARAVVDQAAAVVLLQSWLDARRSDS